MTGDVRELLHCTALVGNVVHYIIHYTLYLIVHSNLIVCQGMASVWERIKIEEVKISSEEGT